MSLRSEVHNLILVNLRSIEREIGHIEDALGSEDNAEKAMRPFASAEGEVKKLSEELRSFKSDLERKKSKDADDKKRK